MTETLKYIDEEHRNIFMKILNQQRLEGEHCDIAVVVEDVEFRAHRCVLAACSHYFKKLFKKHEEDNSVVELDFIRSDIFEEVLNYMYTARITIKKKDINLMMSSGQILGIRFLDKLCTQKRDLTMLEEKSDHRKFSYDGIKMSAGHSQENQDPKVHGVFGDHGTPGPNSSLRVQEAILKELAMEEVRKVSFYDQDMDAMGADMKGVSSHGNASQAHSFTSGGVGDVKDTHGPGWTPASTDMKLEYLLYGHRDTGHGAPKSSASSLDDTLLRKNQEKLHAANRPFVCEICPKAFTTQAHLKEHLKIHAGFKPHRCQVCGKAFIRGPDLKRHERVHSNERPFACQMCEKAFKHKSHLKDHERQHRGERPFGCGSCSKAFIKASDLKRHWNTMHSERRAGAGTEPGEVERDWKIEAGSCS